MATTARRGGMLPTILRGMRARLLLSVGSVLLTALAIGSATLAPVFQQAVTNSYLVARLDQAPNPLTGLTWTWAPVAGQSATEVIGLAEADADEAAGPFAPARARLETDRAEALGGEVQLIAAADACAHLEITGTCPDQPFEVLMLQGDLEERGLEIGDEIEVADPIGTVTVTGSYTVAPDEGEFWFDLTRFASSPRQVNQRTGIVTPYRPAPFVTVPGTFDELPTGAWTARVDRQFDAPPDLTLDDLDTAIRTAATLKTPEQVAETDNDGNAGPGAPRAAPSWSLLRGAADGEGGPLVGDSVNDLPLIAAEVRDQQATARASITPAVISLVLVALALLLRLLMAAADLRLPEIALASLRGLTRRQLWRLGLAEPLTVLAISVPIGGAIGVALSVLLVRWWLVPGLPLPLPWTAWLAGLMVVVAAFGVAVLAVGLVLRVSLSEQLTGVRRPHASSRASVLAQLLLVAAAGSVLASKLAAGAPSKPDVTDLVLPVLLALVAGVAATRLTALFATWLTRRRRTRSLPAYVASRAISRRQEGTLVILPVTAAIAICVFGAGVYTSAADWRASVAATSAPADEVWLSPLPLRQTVGLTHRLDPEGDYLMAASTISTLGPTYAVVDTTRLDRVAQWQDQWTPGLGAAAVADQLGVQEQVPLLSGRRISATIDNGADVDGELTLRLRLDPETGDRPHYAFLGPFPAGEHTRSARIPYCADFCRFDGITLGGPAATTVAMNGPVTISDIAVDGAPLEGAVRGAGWGVAPQASGADAVQSVTSDGETLSVDVLSGSSPVIVQLSAGGVPLALPVLRGVDAQLRQSNAGFGDTSVTEFDSRSIAAANSVPLLGPVGTMIDYTMLTTDRDIYPQDVPVYILARGDTPQEMTDELRARGASVSTTLEEVQRTLDQGAYALALRLYAVVAVLVLVMAMAGLFVSTAVQLPSRRRDAASLRVVGVPRRSVMSAVARELGVVLGATAIAGLAAGTLAQYVVLRTVTLGVVDTVTTPALVAAVDPGRLVLLTLLAGLLFGSVALISAALSVRGARGATLRESAR
jgi:hypothetical protein